MNFSTLMQQAAEQYVRAKQEVLSEWQPACSCDQLGAKPECQNCPSLVVFEKLVGEKIQQVNSHSIPLRKQSGRHMLGQLIMPIRC